MSTVWVMSAHAGTFAEDSADGKQKVHRLIPLPKNVTFHFFEREGVSLDGPKAEAIYYKLMKEGITAEDFAEVQEWQGHNQFSNSKGDKALPNYAILGDDWNDKDNGKSTSGLFIAGDKDHKLTPYVGKGFYLAKGKWYDLEKFVNRYLEPEDEVYWLCCRAWM